MAEELAYDDRRLGDQKDGGIGASNRESPVTAWSAIEAKLVAAQETLLHNGAIVRRKTAAGSVVWVVRYRHRHHGRIRQPTIYLGPKEFADRARTLIARWRFEARSPEQRLQSEVLGTVKMQGMMSGLSGRAQRRLKRFVEGAMDNHLALCAFALGFMPVHDPMIRDGKRSGRPSKAKLW